MADGFDRRALLGGASAAAIMTLLRGAHAGTTPVGEPSRARGALSASTRRVFAAQQTITTLVPERLYRVGCVVRAERLSWLAEDLDAFEPLNFYLLTDRDNCVFMDLGAPIVLPALQSALDSLVGRRRVWVNFTRNEADCIGNLGYVLGSCPNPTMLFGSAGGILEWINDPHVSIMEVRDFLGRIPIEMTPNGTSKRLGELDLSWFDAGLKQMGMTQWAYESTSGCLFTSDTFGYRHAATAESPVVIDSTRGLPSVDAVAREIVARINWLREADAPELIERIEAVFAAHDVRLLAPVHGCVIRGREAVAAHLRLTLAALKRARSLPDRERLRYV